MIILFINCAKIHFTHFIFSQQRDHLCVEKKQSSAIIIKLKNNGKFSLN